MANNDQIVQRWADVATGKEAHNYSRQRNVYAEGDSLYSYGHHFEVARAMRTRGKVTWFLLNGDIWRSGGWHGGSTSRHQELARDVVGASGLPSITVPFSAMQSAGIDYASIKVVESLPESFETTQHHAATLDDVPVSRRPRPASLPAVAGEFNPERYPHGWNNQNAEWSCYTADGNMAATETEDGWTWETHRHWLGSAVFTARYHYWDRERQRDVRGRAAFLSAFDEQEPRPLYFLAQLPRGAKPASYAEAIEALKPPAVLRAEREGKAVLRQGDVFAVPSIFTTRTVHAFGPSERGARVLGVNHTATESVSGMAPDVTFARGVLRHAPGRWRNPEHKRVKLGDGKTWYRLARNTVPDGRSWSMAGNVD